MSETTLSLVHPTKNDNVTNIHMNSQIARKIRLKSFVDLTNSLQFSIIMFPPKRHTEQFRTSNTYGFKKNKSEDISTAPGKHITDLCDISTEIFFCSFQFYIFTKKHIPTYNQY